MSAAKNAGFALLCTSCSCRLLLILGFANRSLKEKDYPAWFSSIHLISSRSACWDRLLLLPFTTAKCLPQKNTTSFEGKREIFCQLA